MTPAAFVALVLGLAMAIKLACDTRVPLSPLRRWLTAGDHVALTGDDPDEGPWAIRGRRPDEREATDVIGWVWLTEPVARYPLAAAQLPTGARVRAWAAELVSCPYCVGAWLSAVAIVGYSIHVGEVGVLFCWPAVWFPAALLVVASRAIGDA